MPDLNYRITEPLRLEEASGDHVVQPLLKQGHPEEVVQDHVQVAFEDLQEGRLHHLSGQPVPVLCHPHSKEVLPDVQTEPLMLQLVTSIIVCLFFLTSYTVCILSHSS